MVAAGVSSAGVSTESLVVVCSKTEVSGCAVSSVSLITSFAIINLYSISFFKVAAQKIKAHSANLSSGIEINRLLRISQIQPLNVLFGKKLKFAIIFGEKSFRKIEIGIDFCFNSAHHTSY
jgi:hypothetical protein